MKLSCEISFVIMSVVFFSYEMYIKVIVKIVVCFKWIISVGNFFIRRLIMEIWNLFKFIIVDIILRILFVILEYEVFLRSI